MQWQLLRLGTIIVISSEKSIAHSLINNTKIVGFIKSIELHYESENQSALQQSNYQYNEITLFSLFVFSLVSFRVIRFPHKFDRSKNRWKL